MSVEWKPGMVDTLGRVVGYVAASGHAYAKSPDGDVCRLGAGAELDYAHPSNTGHILAHVQKANPSGWVAIGYHPDFEASGRGGWFGKIDHWIYYGTLPDVLRAMVGRVSS
jgi:hypothetical protein